MQAAYLRRDRKECERGVGRGLGRRGNQRSPSLWAPGSHLLGELREMVYRNPERCSAPRGKETGHLPTSFSGSSGGGSPRRPECQCRACGPSHSGSQRKPSGKVTGSHCNPRVMDRAPTAPAASFEKAGQAGSLAWKQVELDLRHNEDPKGEATDFRGRLRGGKVVEAPVRLARSPCWILGWAGAVLTNRRRTVLKKHFGPRPRVKPGHTRACVLRRAHAVLCAFALPSSKVQWAPFHQVTR